MLFGFHLLCVVCVDWSKKKHVTISNESDCSLDFSPLHVKDPFITDITQFQYGFNVIDNSVMDKRGMIMSLNNDNCHSIKLQVCNECHSALKRRSVPRLSLANYLYRGKLPDEFNDLTWVEEMVCAKYRNTVQITRIYGSSDSSQPKVFHGNRCTFAEETAGFAEHPAQLFKEKGDSDSSLLLLENTQLLLENTGVSDPDGVKVSVRSSTASALKNLLSPTNYCVPDLVLHRSSVPVPEYNNPDLLPEMYPTLFPLGLGGFDNSLRRPQLSFEAQANALLDVPDKLFRSHCTFIFVALNIIQHRLCHLHNHFTV